ncbi:MAG: RIP metalloprotease RseP [Candidatus Omnitrophota bacterium]
MLTFLIFILILSTVIVVHEFGHFMMARRMGVRVEKFSLGFGPALLKKKKDETEYCLSAIPLGGYVKLAGDNLEEYQGKKDEYLAQAPGRRFHVIFFGPLLNYILGLLLFWVIFVVGYPSLTTRVGGLLDDFGAKDAGLQVGDKIEAVDGKAVVLWEELQKIIQSKKTAEKVRLTVLRDDDKFELEVRIREKSMDDSLGQKRSVGLLGITPADEIITVKHGILESLGLGISKTWELTVMTYKALGFMITGRISMRESITGLPGMYFITSRAAQMGVVAILHLVAVLSLSLAIFNLLPLPVLDGGHILFLGVEKIRGKGLSLNVDRLVTQVGTMLILTLAVFVTYNDLVRFYGDKIDKVWEWFVR